MLIAIIKYCFDTVYVRPFTPLCQTMPVGSVLQFFFCLQKPPVNFMRRTAEPKPRLREVMFIVNSYSSYSLPAGFLVLVLVLVIEFLSQELSQ